MRNIGLIGAGGVAAYHLAAASRHRQTRVLHIADMDLGRARHLADEYGIERVGTDPNEVLLNDNVDMVIVALPTFLHSQWLLRCAEAGKDIVTEKPLCRHVSEAKRVLRACAKYKVRLSVGYMRRFSPARQEVRSLVQSGALGRPVTWRISEFGSRSDFYRGPHNWMWDKDKGGGLIMDGSIHDFDFACWVSGHPTKMYAQSSRISDVVTAPTAAHAIISFKDGDRLVYSVSWQEGDFGSGGFPLSIVGPKGTIALDSDFAFTLYLAGGRKRRFKWDPNSLRPKNLGFSYLFYKQLDSFVREKDDTGLATGEESLLSLWMAEKIIDSGSEGRVFHYRKEEHECRNSKTPSSR